jgi:ubiquinone/menaquinone biosynthesis C-methylase UbiE
MITANSYSQGTIQRAYDRRKWVYSKTIAVVEWPYHLQAIDKAAIQPGEAVLEVAVGPGLALMELAKRVGPQTTIHGADLSPGMLDMTRQRLSKAGFSRLDLRQSDARRLPFKDAQFDVVYNAYMLDLIPEGDMAGILAEFKRVLKPCGRMVLLNMSKPSLDATDSRERLYKLLPRVLTLYLLGACRPVLMEPTVHQAGFLDVERTFIGGRAPSEIVSARKPL